MADVAAASGRAVRLGDILKGRRLRSQEARWGYLFIAPNFVGFALFTAGPVIFSLVLSLMKWDILSAPSFVGVDNYVRLFTGDDLFPRVVRNTVYFTFVSVPLRMAVALVLALALNQPLRGTALYRTIYFLPQVSMLVAVAIVWRYLYSTDFGVINYVLSWFGMKPVRWLTSAAWAMPAVIIMSVWKTVGTPMVIYLAGLQGIPEHLYEAAKIDGAGPGQLFRYITWPLLTPTTFFVLVIGIIGSFQVFAQVYIMTAGGPAYSTTTMVYYIYVNAFQWWKMGYAAAQAWVLFAFILVASLIQVRLQREWVTYD